jgi:probable rRNA maturation factor
MLELAVRYGTGRTGVPAPASFRRWAEAALRGARRRQSAELSIRIVGLAEGAELNRAFRGRDYATNVLSFPYEPAPGEHPGLLGDIVICAPVVLREASEQGKPARDHFAHLAIHGVLHLLGYDHETEADAERMEGIEREVLDSLGIGDPYRQAQITPPRSGPAPR